MEEQVIAEWLATLNMFRTLQRKLYALAKQQEAVHALA